MDIPLWQRRSLSDTPNEQTTPSEKMTKEVETNASINTSYHDFKHSQFFQDVLKALALTADDVSYQDNYLDFGVFNWRFHTSDNIHFQRGQLSTPTFAMMSESSAIKKALWQTIHSNEILY